MEAIVISFVILEFSSIVHYGVLVNPLIVKMNSITKILKTTLTENFAFTFYLDPFYDLDFELDLDTPLFINLMRI